MQGGYNKRGKFKNISVILYPIFLYNRPKRSFNPYQRLKSFHHEGRRPSRPPCCRCRWQQQLLNSAFFTAMIICTPTPYRTISLLLLPSLSVSQSFFPKPWPSILAQKPSWLPRRVAAKAVGGGGGLLCLSRPAVS